MRHPIGLILVGLLSLPLPASSSSRPALRPGALALAFLPGTSISLGLDAAAISAALCSPARLKNDGPIMLVEPAEPATLSARGNCGITVTLPPDKSLAKDFLADPIAGKIEVRAPASPGDPERVFLRLTALELTSKIPFVTPCGSFDFTVRLDPDDDQPPSELRLLPDGGDPPQGVFSAILLVRAELRMTPVGGGPGVTLPASLRIPIGGPWAQVEDPSAESSNLLLFARHESDGWHQVPSCLSFSRPCGYFCLMASSRQLEGLSDPGEP